MTRLSARTCLRAAKANHPERYRRKHAEGVAATRLPHNELRHAHAPTREIVIGVREVAGAAREDLTIGHRPHLLARMPTGGTRLLRASISPGRVTARRAHRAGCEDRTGTRVLMVSASVPT